jgi:hypothetical protein
MPRSPAALVVLVCLILATGCGSDDEPADSSGSGAAETTEQKQSTAPARASARSKLVDCVEGEGYEISHEGDDAAKATSYTIGPEDPRRAKAEITIHPNRDEAASSARRAGEEEGINSVAFGRAEFIRRQATDTEAGRIVNCISMAYGG